MSLEDNGDGTWNINFTSDSDIGGFQFEVDGSNVSACAGGAAADAGFTVSPGGSTVLAFSFTGATIPAGSGILTTITVDSSPIGISEIVISDANGIQLDFVYDDGSGDDGGGDDGGGDDGGGDDGFSLTYSVYKDGTLLAEGITETTYTDSGLDEGASFTYTVTQTNGTDSTPVSNSVTATTFVNGCTDTTACNYNSSATNDNGSCIYVDGICETCVDGAIVDNDANDNGTCDDAEVLGCMDSSACNYNSSATTDDGSCDVPDTSLCEVCVGITAVAQDADGDGVCDSSEVAGCTSSTACNYDASATDDDGSCLEPTGCDTCANGAIVDNDADDDTVCDDQDICADGDDLVDTDGDTVPDACEVGGCTDSAADNYSADATEDDGTCEYTPVAPLLTSQMINLYLL